MSLCACGIFNILVILNLFTFGGLAAQDLVRHFTISRDPETSSG